MQTPGEQIYSLRSKKGWTAGLRQGRLTVNGRLPEQRDVDHHRRGARVGHGGSCCILEKAMPRLAAARRCADTKLTAHLLDPDGGKGPKKARQRAADGAIRRSL